MPSAPAAPAPRAMRGEVVRLPESWDLARHHAREFERFGRMAADHAILCGLELLQLKANQPERRGGDRKSAAKDQKSYDKTFDFDDLIKREIGVSRDTAYRWMAAAKAQLPCIAGMVNALPEQGDDEWTGAMEADIIAIFRDVPPEELQKAVNDAAHGKTLEQLLLPLGFDGAFDPSRLIGKDRDAWEKICALAAPWSAHNAESFAYTAEDYEAWHPHAEAAKAKVEAMEVTPARAWAGMRGRACTLGQGRREVDHYRNLATAVTKLKTSLPHYDAMSPDDRSELETLWEELLPILPGPWKAQIAVPKR